MSRIVCIPCLNMEVDEEFIIHRHSMGKCSMCGEKAGRLRQSLLISFVSKKSAKQSNTKNILEMGCANKKCKDWNPEYGYHDNCSGYGMRKDGNLCAKYIPEE